jgi:hypothetical protein
MQQGLGLAIRVPDGPATLRRIRRDGYLPLHGRPLQLGLPGATVVVVQAGGMAPLVARGKRLEGPTSVKLVDGQKREGYKLWLTRIRRPTSGTRLGIKWHAIGQFRYFDPPRWAPTVIGPLEASRGDYLDEVATSGPGLTVKRGPFTGSVQGKPRSHPECALLRRFVAWLNCEEALEQHRLLPDRFFTDLFDTSRWRLIEAKLACDRQTLRAALGQLYDYRRFYLRRPSLGVLLGARPTKRCVAFLRDHRVTAVWETGRGSFSDSADGTWSRLRRAR